MADILLVDESILVCNILAALLRAKGHKVERAANGQEALARFGKQEFDLVLMDVYLPLINGLDACQQLREQSQVPILMLSAFPDPSIQRRAMDCGATAFLSKPLNPERLLSWISRTISNQPSLGSAPLSQALGAW